MDLNQWQSNFFDAGRIPQEANKEEIIEGLDIVAQAMMEGKATMAHANAILSMRFAIMTLKDKQIEMSKLGGSSRSEAKKAASAENGKLGGRPRKAKE